MLKCRGFGTKKREQFPNLNVDFYHSPQNWKEQGVCCLVMLLLSKSDPAPPAALVQGLFQRSHKGSALIQSTDKSYLLSVV